MFRTQVFYNFMMFDGVNSQVQPDCWLEVTDGHIHRIGTGALLRRPIGRLTWEGGRSSQA